ncbi:MAG: hypothetical protein SFY68_01810 [Candidatus Sumerlaeia bacterium]|nr:hypothetical protein [Candidatus Sumerlaeia bacterium]
MAEAEQNGAGSLSPLFWGLTATYLILSIWFATASVREETIPLQGMYLILFVCYVGLCWIAFKTSAYMRILMGVFLLSRLIFLPSVPTLSDDVYRFLWDGTLSLQGINPFAHLPSELMEGKVIVEGFVGDSALYSKMNSPNYYTIYPPICQCVFALASGLSQGWIWLGIIVIRFVLIAAECRAVWVLWLILKYQGMNPAGIFLYALNPLVLLEITGNLHFEGLMIWFLLETIWNFQRGQMNRSALWMALAVSTKLLPLIFLPLLLRRLSIRQQAAYYGIVGFVTVLLLSPLLSTAFLNGFGSSIKLYFQTFEFNPSVYLIARAIGYWYKGWNMIEQNGKIMAILTFLAIMSYALVWGTQKRAFPLCMQIVWFLYLFFALTVHPWYALPLVAFASMTGYRFGILWSYTIFWTYAGYRSEEYIESIPLIAVEYGLVIVVLLWEWWQGPLGKEVEGNLPSSALTAQN